MTVIGHRKGSTLEENMACLLYTSAAGREQQGDDESQQDGQGAQGERGHEVVQNFCAELHAVGVDDHGRDDEVDQQVRESLLALGAEQAGLGTRCV